MPDVLDVLDPIRWYVLRSGRRCGTVVAPDVDMARAFAFSKFKRRVDDAIDVAPYRQDLPR